MEKLNLLDNSINMNKMARAQSLLTGASFLFSGIKHLKENPKSSVAKSLLGGFLIYRGITGHCHMRQMLEGATEVKA